MRRLKLGCALGAVLTVHDNETAVCVRIVDGLTRHSSVAYLLEPRDVSRLIAALARTKAARMARKA